MGGGWSAGTGFPGTDCAVSSKASDEWLLQEWKEVEGE